AEINSAVRGAFHSTCATRFHRPQRSVQPKINPLHEAPSDVTVVIFQKHNPVFESCFVAESVNFLNQRAAAFIARMRFAGENKLHRSRSIVEQSLQALFITKQERAAFVSREPSRKTDRQNFRIENLTDTAN